MSIKRTATLLLLLALSVAGCDSTRRPGGVTFSRADTETEYALTPTANGFSLLVLMTRPMVPYREKFAEVCAWRTHELAFTLAGAQGRAIQPLAFQQILTQIRSNYLYDTSLCRATVTAVWQ